jgi:hypothetical protein
VSYSGKQQLENRTWRMQMDTEAALKDRDCHEEVAINQSKIKRIFEKLLMYQTYVSYSRQFDTLVSIFYFFLFLFGL